MKGNNSLWYFAIGALVLLMVLGVTQCVEKPINWREDYRRENKDVYGTFLCIKFLEDLYADHRVDIIDDLSEQSIVPTDSIANYIFVGKRWMADSVTKQSVLDFVEAGNTALIATNQMDTAFWNIIHQNDCEWYYEEDTIYAQYEYYYDTIARFDFYHEDLMLTDTHYTFGYRGRFGNQSYTWRCIPESYFCNNPETILPLGSIFMEDVNFAEINFGQGRFLFHTNPILMTNAFLMTPKGQEYNQKLWAHLDRGTIYWDEDSRTNAWGDSGGWGNRTFSDKSPLLYVLNQPQLAWAWYILLAIGILYLIFRSKREQRMIPILDPNTNTSLNFVNTIGRLSFLNQNHRQLALDQMRLFLIHVKNQHKVSIKNIDQEFVQKLSLRSGVSTALIEDIIARYKNIERSQYLSEGSLAQFHQLIEKFYDKSSRRTAY